MVVFWLECGYSAAGRERKREIVVSRAVERER
jgi:hypothetical protein